MLGLISQHSLIGARMAFDERRGRELAAATGVETDYAVLVKELADPADYPILSRVVSGEPADGPGPDPTSEFLFDLGLILDGFESAIR